MSNESAPLVLVGVRRLPVPLDTTGSPVIPARLWQPMEITDLTVRDR